jgi:hypothetical protein
VEHLGQLGQRRLLRILPKYTREIKRAVELSLHGHTVFSSGAIIRASTTFDNGAASKNREILSANFCKIRVEPCYNAGMELPAGERDWLIMQLNQVSSTLNETPDGPAHDELKADLKRLVRLLWLDGEPEPD